MFLMVLFECDWNAIHKFKLKHINDNNRRENKKRIQHFYHEGELVTLEKPSIIPNLNLPGLGPYQVHKIHYNRTFTFQKENYITEKVNL